MRRAAATPVGAGLLALLAVAAALASAAPRPDPDRPGRARRAPAADAAGPEVRDPLLAFLVAVAEGDSLGAWDRAGLEARVAAAGRTTRLPLSRLLLVERSATGADAEARDGARVERAWRLVFDDDLALPMPYSILGYHPGTLRIARELRLSEWRLGDAQARLQSGDSTAVFALAGTLCWRLDAGWLVLDADGWLDRILGGSLDDSWTDGLALARVGGELVGIAMGTNPKGRRLLGQLDFRADKVLPNGRPAARAVSAFCRPWTAPPAGQAARAWTVGR